MNHLTKSYGKGVSTRPVLKNVNLSFYPGAKIGVLGANGSGKSTLMKVGGLVYKFKCYGYTWCIIYSIAR